MQQRSELPEGWESSNLETVSQLISGSGFPLKYQEEIGQQFPFFKVGNLGEVESGQYLVESKHTVNEETVKELRAKIIPKESIVFAKIGMAIALNRRRLIGVPACIDNNMMAAIPHSVILPKFLLRYLETIDFMQYSQATTVPSLRKAELGKILIPLPSLAEQHRIVAAIEALFARLDATEARLARVPEIMKQFRQSVLAAACEGRLTKDWRADSSESHANQWYSSKIKDIFEYWGGATPSTSNPLFWDGEIPWISSKDMKSWKISKGELFITKEAFNNSKLRICPINSVLVVVRSGILRHTLPIALTESNLAINQDLKAFYNHDNDLNNWLALYLKGKTQEILMNLRKDGTTVQSINFNQLLDMNILIPPKAEQHEIVHRVDALLAYADRIEARFTATQERTEQLRQSILEQAFSGQLVRGEAKT